MVETSARKFSFRPMLEIKADAGAFSEWQLSAVRERSARVRARPQIEGIWVSANQTVIVIRCFGIIRNWYAN